MGYFKRAAGCAAILAVFLAPTQIFAQDSENKVLAKIDGVVIRQSDFDLFASLDPQFAQLQGEQKQLAILASLIDLKTVRFIMPISVKTLSTVLPKKSYALALIKNLLPQRHNLNIVHVTFLLKSLKRQPR
jgi:hypothetical protein